MRWNNRPKVERPEYPKMVPIATLPEAQELLASLLVEDPDTAIVDAGARSVYLKVHNEAADAAATLGGEARSFPLA